jgi:hypothetical protein
MKTNITCIILTLLLITLPIAYLRNSLLGAMEYQLGSTFQGELLKPSERLDLSSFKKLAVGPVLSETGDVAFFADELEGERLSPILWKNHENFVVIDQEWHRILSLDLSPDGYRAVILGYRTAGKTSSLALWEDGFGMTDLSIPEISGSWKLKFSGNGRIILVLPLDSTATASESFKQGFRIELLSRFSEDQSTPRIPDNKLRYNIYPLSNSILSSSALVSSQSSSTIRPARVKFDLNHDNKEDLLFFGGNKELATWKSYLSSGFQPGIFPTTMTWLAGDAAGIPVPADYNGDGVLDLATYSPGGITNWTSNLGSINWRIFTSARDLNPYLTNSISPTGPSIEFRLGEDGHLPVLGDFDGDGKSDAATFNRWNKTWKILFAHGGFSRAKAELFYDAFGTFFLWSVRYGRLVPGDYNGDGKTDLAFYVAGDGKKKSLWVYRSLQANFATQPKNKMLTTRTKIEFGNKDDIALPGDFNGDGKTDPAIYRPQDGAWYIRYSNGKRVSIQVINFKAEGEPLVGDFDGDGKDDPSFFNEANGEWKILHSSFPGSLNINWAPKGYTPIKLIYRKLYAR